jgi:hypothetical protein
MAQSDEAVALVDAVQTKWFLYKAEVSVIELRARKRMEKEVAAELLSAKLAVAVPLRAALDAGATKVALRAVTSKNPGTLEGFLDLLVPRAEMPVDVVPARELAAIVWEGDILRIDVSGGSGLFEPFLRGDGTVLILPGEGSKGGAEVLLWLQADPANEQSVVDWVAANPQ